MRFASVMAGATVLALAPFSLDAQSASKNLAIDFRTKVTVSGMADTGFIQGHAVGSGDKLRMDLTMKGRGAQVSPLGSPGGEISMILSDSGKTVTYLDAKNSHYVRVRPAEMMAQVQQMGGVKMDFSETQAKVENLGAGPTILGHPTSHYRIQSGMTININAMGEQQSVKISTTTDYYYANDIKGVLNPFASLNGSDMAAMFGGSNKDFADRMKVMQEKLPKSTPLRATSGAIMTTMNQTRITTTEAEVTSVQWVDANPKIFEVPAGYTAVTLPGMAGAQSGAIPPK